MKSAKIGNNRIVYYDGDITELPMKRFHQFQKMLLIDAGIGSENEDIITHIERARVYIEKEEKDKAIAELMNAKKNIELIMQSLHPKHLAFASLVYILNDRLVTDISDEGLKKISLQINSVQTKWIIDVVDCVKKKLRAN